MSDSSRFPRYLLSLSLLIIWNGAPVPAAEPTAGKPVYNSQAEGQHPDSPEADLKKITMPPGFQVTLFAGEPAVSQPVAMAMDDRGRLWVAEFYTYAGRGYDGELRDRIVILHDTDGDGRHDERTVFWDQGNRLTSLLPGSGGCWILNEGTLAWLPDADGDSRADGPPQPVLDGFNYEQAGHNIVNGLTWGPEGWIYGRHGILATSYVGSPGMSQNERTLLNCSIWRYHPQQKRFEVVTHGTTNPWGMDYNDVGDLFFTNNVIGHAWQVIPGARYKRMYGADFNPHFYELIDQHADHYHWDNSFKWTDSREDKGVHGKLGGGHSHCGGMIYLGDNWPDEHRHHLFMCNTHGRRLNEDVPVRAGSGYVIKRGQDMFFANQPWFRGTEVLYGPDGAVYVSDWTDLGECHDEDGVHRLSGRVYKVTYGQPTRNFQDDLSQYDSEKLVELHLHKNDWFVRHARRLLIDRKSTGVDLGNAVAKLKEIFATHQETPRRLKALWTLYALEELTEADYARLLESDNEYLRAWGVRFLMDGPEVSPAGCELLLQLAQNESSPYVRLSLTSALQKMPEEPRWKLAFNLCSRPEDASDHNIPLMIWYGMEPLVSRHPGQAAALLNATKIPVIRQFLARRLMHENENDPQVGTLLVQALNANADPQFQQEILTGMTEATRGWRKTQAPENWEAVSPKLLASQIPQVAEMTRELSVVFGDGRAMDHLRTIIENGDAAPIDRRNALQVLINSRPEGTLPLLQRMAKDKVLDDVAVAGLAAFDDPNTPNLLLGHFRWLQPAAREVAINTLSTRPEYARPLLLALKENRLMGATLTASQARQIASFENKELTELLENVWGSLQTTDEQKRHKIHALKEQLTPEFLSKADLSQGRLLYNQTCSACHRLFDAGIEIGPNLTGSNRDNIDYLLENMVDPSAVVPRQYQISTVVLADGRILNGLVVTQTERTLTLQTEREKLNIDQDDVELVKPSPLSLMPEGQLDKLTPEQIRDLVAYLQSPRQVALPE